MRLSRLFMIALLCAFAIGVGAIVLSAMPMVLSIWVELLAGSAFTVAGGCLPAAVCAATLERGRIRGLMWSGIVSAVLAIVGWVGAYIHYSQTWNPDFQTIANLMMLPSMWAMVCMMTALLFHNRRQSLIVNAVAVIAWLASLTTILIISLVVWSEGMIVRDGFEGVFFVFVILASFGTLLTLVLQRLPQLSGAVEADQVIVRMPMQVWCPRCGMQQQIETGGAHCASCGLSIGVIVP